MSQTKKLYRSTSDRMIAGICGGIAQYLKTDSSIIRIGFVFLTLITWFVPGILFYFAVWFIVPEKNK